MTLVMVVIALSVIAMSLMTLIEFIAYVKGDGDFLKRKVRKFVEHIFVLVLPWIYICFTELKNEIDCCDNSILFAPDYRIAIFVWIGFVQLCFLYASYRKGKSSPIIEVVINCGLLIGIVLNIVICIQMNSFLWIIGNIPVILIFVMKLMDNQKALLDEVRNGKYEGFNFLMEISDQILKSRLLIRYPLLLLLCLPVVTIITGVLVLFGQRVDAIILVFTQTYGMQFSQLDHLCQNVNCGGHYLCSVAANGHSTVVKPFRYGVRAGSNIICNRQLLVCNAVENVIEDMSPNMHKIIRRNYDRVGDHIHNNYEIYETKIVSDLIYLLMKPIEYLFIGVLYLVDSEPENRIAMQYLSEEDKRHLWTELASVANSNIGLKDSLKDSAYDRNL